MKAFFSEVFGVLLALVAVCVLFIAAWVLFYGLPCAIAILLGAS